MKAKLGSQQFQTPSRDLGRMIKYDAMRNVKIHEVVWGQDGRIEAASLEDLASLNLSVRSKSFGMCVRSPGPQLLVWISPARSVRLARAVGAARPRRRPDAPTLSSHSDSHPGHMHPLARDRATVQPADHARRARHSAGIAPRRPRHHR